MKYKVGSIVLFKSLNKYMKLEEIKTIFPGMEKYLGKKHKISYHFIGSDNKTSFYCVEDNDYLWNGNIIEENIQMEFDF